MSEAPATRDDLLRSLALLVEHCQPHLDFVAKEEARRNLGKPPTMRARMAHMRAEDARRLVQEAYQLLGET